MPADDWTCQGFTWEHTYVRKKETEQERLGGPSNIDASYWERRAEGGWVRATGLPGSFRKASAVRFSPGTGLTPCPCGPVSDVEQPKGYVASTVKNLQTQQQEPAVECTSHSCRSVRLVLLGTPKARGSTNHTLSLMLKQRLLSARTNCFRSILTSPQACELLRARVVS